MSGSLTDRELLDIWFIGKLPSDFSAAKEAISKFYKRGKEPRKRENEGQAPIYSFREDAEAIIAAFQKEYGIDLTTASMHWWRFSALLEGLITDSFTDRVQYRACNPDSIKSKDLRAKYQKLKAEYALDRHGKRVERPTTLEEYNALLRRRARGEE